MRQVKGLRWEHTARAHSHATERRQGGGSEERETTGLPSTLAAHTNYMDVTLPVSHSDTSTPLCEHVEPHPCTAASNSALFDGVNPCTCDVSSTALRKSTVMAGLRAEAGILFSLLVTPMRMFSIWPFRGEAQRAASSPMYSWPPENPLTVFASLEVSL